MCSRQCSRNFSSERLPFSGTVPEDGAFLKSSVRNVGGNVDNLRAVWLDTHFSFLLYPAHFVEHGSKVVRFSTPKVTLILAEEFTPDFHVAHSGTRNGADTSGGIHTGEKRASLKQIHVVPILGQKRFQIFTHKPFALDRFQSFPLFLFSHDLDFRIEMQLFSCVHIFQNLCPDLLDVLCGKIP